ncbi:MAG: lysophospholipid acyltransferase family protein [Sphingopyxis sp.]
MMADVVANRPVGLVSRGVLAAMLALYRRHGWRAEGAVPTPRKFVLIAAPHTSNWDFVYYLGLTQELGLNTSFMAKKSLFRWPMGGFMRAMGGVEVDRSGGHNYVQAMVDEFARRDEFVLTIAPEGTRGSVRQWRTGFYHIAQQAGVPIVIGMMDYARKVGGLGPAIVPTGDYAADMAPIEAYYKSVTPKHPAKKMQNVVQAAPDNG